MSHPYENPKYYEIAFSFRDIAAEVDTFEVCFQRFARIPVRSVLELACGNSPHMEELARRGYSYTGLDSSKAMLAYSASRASKAGIKAHFIHGDMADFSLDEPVDFAFVALGSLFVTSTTELVKHFQAVARAVKEGGLYLLDWCVQFTAPSTASADGESWEMERDGIRVKTAVSSRDVDLVEQLFEETLVLEVDDHGQSYTFSGSDIRRAIYPQEFLLFIDSLAEFEFVGWWNNWNLDEPLDDIDAKTNRPIALVRRI